jgi:hypothetical protein
MSIGCIELFLKCFFNHEKDERDEKEKRGMNRESRESARMKTGQDHRIVMDRQDWETALHPVDPLHPVILSNNPFASILVIRGPNY